MHIHSTVGQAQKGARLPDLLRLLDRTPAPRAMRPAIEPLPAERPARPSATPKHIKHYGAGF